MILTFHSGSGDSVMMDLYIQTIESLTNKNNIIVTLPSFLKDYKDINKFKMGIIEDFSKKSKIKLRLELILFSIKLYNICKKNDVKKIFIMCENNWHIIYLIPIIKLLNLEIYIWVHDPVLHSGERKVIKRARKLIDRYIIKKAIKIIVSYEEAKEILIKEYEINSNNINVIWLPELKNAEFPQLREKSSIIYDCIFFGRIEAYKGIDIFINSLKFIKEKYGYNGRALIVGRGQEAKKVKDIIKNNNLNINFINEYVTNYDLAKYINSSKIVILPYKDATGTQTVQIANYYKKPVIANNVGSFKEYVTKDNGILLRNLNDKELGECIYKLIKDDILYNNKIKSIDKFFYENFST
ncbi:glycosyltransferase family 4 protein [Clostridium perfringens]|nr:glycosyltransferase [Clostridium perfringens]MBI6045818.1 glycosyltransferase family 4 protein [Clostridium perfringens]